MLNFYRYLSLLVTSLSLMTNAWAMDDCTSHTSTQTLCSLKIEDLRPTQFSVGYRSVKKKAKKLQQMDHDAYQDYLKSHPIPVVIGNHGQFYALDHHHLSRAVIEIGHHKVVAQIIQNWQSLSATNFWNQMVANQYVYLFDDGVKRSPSDLPQSISQLRDDPYRSLSGEVRDEGGYSKGKIYFIEFTWANYFRTRISAELVRDQFKSAVRIALALAHSGASSSMPGYSPYPVRNP
jgi:hypothetical protein